MGTVASCRPREATAVVAEHRRRIKGRTMDVGDMGRGNAKGGGVIAYFVGAWHNAAGEGTPGRQKTRARGPRRACSAGRARRPRNPAETSAAPLVQPALSPWVLPRRESNPGPVFF